MRPTTEPGSTPENAAYPPLPRALCTGAARIPLVRCPHAPPSVQNAKVQGGLPSANHSCRPVGFLCIGLAALEGSFARGVGDGASGAAGVAEAAPSAFRFC